MIREENVDWDENRATDDEQDSCDDQVEQEIRVRVRWSFKPAKANHTNLNIQTFLF